MKIKFRSPIHRTDHCYECDRYSWEWQWPIYRPMYFTATLATMEYGPVFSKDAIIYSRSPWTDGEIEIRYGIDGFGVYGPIPSAQTSQEPSSQSDHSAEENLPAVAG